MGTFGRVLRISLILIWAAVILLAAVFYLSEPRRLNALEIALFIKTFETEIWLVYLAMSALRGFTLLPSTPLVLAGTLLYPDQPWLVLTISMTGILTSSSLIYFFSDALGFSRYFEQKKPETVAAVRRRLEQPAGLAFVALWAFFPLVPTDAVCYAAGTSRMHFGKFILAVIAGELVLCSIYIFTGSTLLTILT